MNALGNAMSRIVPLVLGVALLAGCATPPQGSRTELEQQVATRERAFAQTMADRNFTAFPDFIAADAIFFTGPTPLRGREQVVAGWKRFYERPAAPFSWQPETVEVLDSGTLAISSGPVRGADGKLIATFTSIWRMEAPGVWRVIFDKGNPECDCASAAAKAP
jgi:ketosteroid isomerase-like protein